jgi:hypothetical protein
MELDSNSTQIILAIIAAIGITVAVTIRIVSNRKNLNNNTVNQKNIKAGGNVSGRDTNVNNKK